MKNWTEEEKAKVSIAIARIRQFAKDHHYSQNDLWQMSNGRITRGMVKHHLEKNLETNHMTKEALEVYAEYMNEDPNDLLLGYESILNPSWKRKNKDGEPKKPIPQILDLFYNVEETTEETTTIAELEDSIEFIVEDLEHYIGQLQRVLYRLHKFENKGDRK